MVKIIFNKEKNRIAFYIKGGNFRDVVDLFREHNSFISYDITKKFYYCSPVHFELLNIAKDLAEIDTIDLSRQDYEEIKNFVYKQIVGDRPIIKENLFLSKPLGDFQIENIKRIVSYKHQIIGDDCGTGKTFSAITGLNHLLDSNYVNKIIVLTVPEGKYNWKKEILQFSSFFKEEDIFIANKNSRDCFETQLNKKIIIIDYNTFLLSSDYHYKLKHKKSTVKKYRKATIPLDNFSKDLSIVLDECHMMKNPDARRTNALLIHSDFFKSKLFLSGTLTPKAYYDIFCYIKMIDKNILDMSMSEFKKILYSVGNEYSSTVVNTDSLRIEVKDKLEKIISPYIIKHGKEVIRHLLTNVIIKKLYIEPKGKFYDIYKSLIDYELFKLNDNGLLTYKVENRFPYILQACGDPSLLKGKLDPNTTIGNLLQDWNFLDNPKLEYIDSIINQAKENKEKVIVWSENPSILDQLHELYKENSLVVHGQNTPKGMDKDEFRDKQLLLFAEEEKYQILFANPSTLGTARNIVCASVVIYFNRSFNYTYFYQSLNRVDRPGQTKDIKVYMLLLDESLDVLCDKVLEQRIDLNTLTFKKTYLNTGDLKQLFTGKLI